MSPQEPRRQLPPACVDISSFSCVPSVACLGCRNGHSVVCENCSEPGGGLESPLWPSLPRQCWTQGADLRTRLRRPPLARPCVATRPAHRAQGPGRPRSVPRRPWCHPSSATPLTSAPGPDTVFSVARIWAGPIGAMALTRALRPLPQGQAVPPGLPCRVRFSPPRPPALSKFPFAQRGAVAKLLVRRLRRAPAREEAGRHRAG